MKKSILLIAIVLLLSCYSTVYAAGNTGPDNSKGNNENADTSPVILHSAVPGFPVAAEEARVEGFVTIKFLVTKDGDVENPRVVESVPPNYFDSAALNALKKYKFKPATKNGVPVDFTLEWPFTFSFPGSSFSGDINSKLQAYRYASTGKSLLDKNEYQKAVDKLSEAIKLQPKYSSAYYQRSDAYMKMDKYEKALSDIDKAIELDPKVFGYYNHRGLVYLFWKKYPEAIKNFVRSIQIEPSNIFAYIYRGDTYRSSGRYKDAITDYTSALSFNDKLITVHNNRGYTYYKLKDNNDACSDFKKSCDLGDCRGLEYLKEKGVCDSSGSAAGY